MLRLSSKPHQQQRLFSSLFGGVPRHQQASSQRSQEDIIRQITAYKNSIASKSAAGQGLSRSIAASVEPDKHVKLQRYEVFMDKMQRLYKSELRFSQKQKKRFAEQRNAILYSLTPLKDILRVYNDLSGRGFNSEAAVSSLKAIESVLRARGYKGRVQGDYTPSELDQSWRMQKLADDLKFGLQPQQFFSPSHLAQVSLGLGEIGYKSTDLIPKVFDKLNQQLDERQLGTRLESTELSFKDAVYGGPKNFLERHYVFKGFQSSEEFNEYLSILLDWETSSPRHQATQEELSEQASEVQQAMADIVNAAVQVKELQQDHQASIDNLRHQYFQMKDAADKHTFLTDNQYIRYDMLELQELLVKGGYIEPEESLSNEPFDQRMQRAADVFYDYVINYAPELLSPQHNAYYEAAVAQGETPQQKSSQDYLQEGQNMINMATLSQSLVGLSEQALSYRRDTEDHDYLNKFYEHYLHPVEQKLHGHDARELHYAKATTVMMERCYLKAWQLFKVNVERIIPRFATLVKEDKNSIDGQLHALAALSASRHEVPALKAEIVDNANKILEQATITDSAIVAGLKGLAESPSNDDKAMTLARSLSARLDASILPFKELVQATWSLAALSLYEGRAMRVCVERLNSLSFERVDSEVKYEEYLRLTDIYHALRLEAPESLRITNKGLLSAIQSKDIVKGLKYEEDRTKYDPFKNRVVHALSKGLTSASINHQVIMENELFQNQTIEQDVLNETKYPYKPDIIMGFKGAKVGVFVVPETSAALDTYRADGAHAFRMRLLEKSAGIKMAAIAVNEVVSYDIERFHISPNSNFDFLQTLESQVHIPSTGAIDFSQLSDFGARFVREAADWIGEVGCPKEASKLDAFVQRLYQVMQLRQQVDLRFEPEHRATGHDMLRFQLMKLSLLFDTLSAESRQAIDRDEQGSFQSLLLSTVASIPKSSQESAHVAAGLDATWLGTRLEVEMHTGAQNNIRKSIVPELINQRFMWVEDYHHYSDWRSKQQSVFDNFNLLVVPSPQDAAKYYFDGHARRIPQGVFPYPNHKRQLMLPAGNLSLSELTRSQHHDSFVLFEKEPYKLMVVNELKKAEKLQPIDSEVSMITNLQNIKQGLKSDYTDQEILNVVLLNLSFTDKLIEEHLRENAGAPAERKFVARDADEFRDFVHSTYRSKGQEDPYTHFYLKEARGREEIKRIHEEGKRIDRETDSEREYSKVQEGEKQTEALNKKVEDLLLQEEYRNEDLMDVSSSLRSHIDVKYDLKTLVKSEFVYDMEPELEDPTLTSEQYLEQYRRRAESRLIKSKIILKLWQAGGARADLTVNERLYLKKWVDDLQTRNLLTLRDSMVPHEVTRLTIGDMEAMSIYALNSISRVGLERDIHGAYSLSDLIVEVSHFLDEEVVNKVEAEIFSDKLRRDWGLSPDFKVVETRNKEIGLVLNELEEVAWRSAGQLSDKDFEQIKAMISVKRNKDYFDKQFYENDMKSFRGFFDAVNTYDDRMQLLERWLVRKEDEIKARVILPPADLKHPDQAIFAKLEAPRKKARECLASRLLVADEHGNPIEKEYNELTSRELHVLVENLCLRLYLFNYEYPSFVPQVIRAVKEHPLLLKSDSDQLDLYCRMFELDWRGDRSFQNKQEFMSTHPIYLDGTNITGYGEVNNEVVRDKLQRACAPFVEELARQLSRQ